MYKIEKVTWDTKNTFREDLILAQKALDMGYSLNVRKEFLPEVHSVPFDGIVFNTDKLSIWSTIINWKKVWIVADLVDNHFVGHRRYENLMEALEINKGGFE